MDVHAVSSRPVARETGHRRVVHVYEMGAIPAVLPEQAAPAREGQTRRGAIEVVDACSGPVARAKPTGPRVLIVDDNEDATELLAETLSNAGYETMVAYDGPEALRAVAATPPDVALIDIGLPVMDGYELAARLREDRPASALRLIALTGYGQESDRERSRSVGFDLHLVKPVDLDTLLRAIAAPPS